MTPPQIVMYTTGWCPYCARARNLFAGKGVEIKEIDVEAIPGSREEMMKLSGRRTVPQIFIDNKHVGGSDDLLALDAARQLDPLLGRPSS